MTVTSLLCWPSTYVDSTMGVKQCTAWIHLQRRRDRNMLLVLCVKVWSACEPGFFSVQDAAQYEARYLECDAHDESHETRKQRVWSAVYCSDDPSWNYSTFVQPLQSWRQWYWHNCMHRFLFNLCRLWHTAVVLFIFSKHLLISDQYFFVLLIL